MCTIPIRREGKLGGFMITTCIAGCSVGAGCGQSLRQLISPGIRFRTRAGMVQQAEFSMIREEDSFRVVQARSYELWVRVRFFTV